MHDMKLLRSLLDDPPVLLDWLKEHGYDTAHLEYMLSVTIDSGLSGEILAGFGILSEGGPDGGQKFGWRELAASRMTTKDGVRWEGHGGPANDRGDYYAGLTLNSLSFENAHVLNWLIKLYRGQAQSIDLPAQEITAAGTAPELLSLMRGFSPSLSWDREKLARTYEKYGDQESADKLRNTRTIRW